ncbi:MULTISPECIES: hypothetical protein [unclassified Blastococcus]
MSEAAGEARAAVVFCGERHDLRPGAAFTIGRDADLVVDDDNPFLHRRLLSIEQTGGLWWLANTGARLTATVSDRDGLLQSWLGPGAAVPLVLPHTVVLFTAGPTTYEVEVLVPATYVPVGAARDAGDGATTLAPPVLTPSQYLLVLALSEPLLRQAVGGRAEIPTNVEAARRLGWALTRFNRKLDNVCQKLARSGVRGLHGARARWPAGAGRGWWSTPSAAGWSPPTGCTCSTSRSTTPSTTRDGPVRPAGGVRAGPVGRDGPAGRDSGPLRSATAW